MKTARSSRPPRTPLHARCLLPLLVASAGMLGVAADASADILISDERVDILRKRVNAQAPITYDAWLRVKAVADQHLDLGHRAPGDWFVPWYYEDPQGHSDAKWALQLDANSAYQLALAYRVTGDARYGAASSQLIDGWASTLQSVSSAEDSALTFSYHFPAMIFAADLIRESDVWTPEQDQRFSTFLREKALPVNTSHLGNNWGNWGLVLKMGVGAYLDDQAIMDDSISRWKHLLEEQIDEQGHLHHEVTRNNGTGTHGIWYSHFSLMPTTLGAEMALVSEGVDLYAYESADGDSLEKAFVPLAGWTNDPSTFPYYEGDLANLAGVNYASYFEILNTHFPNADADAVLGRLRPMTADHSAPALTFTHGGITAVSQPTVPEPAVLGPVAGLLALALRRRRI